MYTIYHLIYVYHFSFQKSWFFGFFVFFLLSSQQVIWHKDIASKPINPYNPNNLELNQWFFHANSASDCDDHLCPDSWPVWTKTSAPHFRSPDCCISLLPVPLLFPERRAGGGRGRGTIGLLPVAPSRISDSLHGCLLDGDRPNR